MKRFWSILLHVGIIAGTTAAQIYLPPGVAQIVIPVLAAAGAGVVANKTSTSNPDGTPAQTAWIPPSPFGK